MSVRRRTPTGVVPIGQPAQGLQFPPSLLHPPQTQITRYSDSVTDRIERLDLHARRLGEGFGIPYTAFVLNPLALPSDTSPASIAVAALERFLIREERVSLERRSGRWGLFFVRAPSLVGREAPSEPQPLREAPLDVRERFLLKSEQFFREYLELCEDRLGKMKLAVNAADRTVTLLDRVELG